MSGPGTDGDHRQPARGFRAKRRRRRGAPPPKGTVAPDLLARFSERHRSFSGGRVLVIGDSHTWMAGAGSQYPSWDVDCLPGRGTRDGVEDAGASLEERHDVVVFDVATNDVEMSPADHWRELLRLRELVAPRRLVLVTCWRLDLSLEHVVGNQRRLVAEYPASTSVADWAQFAAPRPQLYLADRIHFSDEALLARTGIIRAEVQAAQLSAESARSGCDPTPGRGPTAER